MYGASMMCLYYNYMAWNNYTQKTDKLEVGALEFQQPPMELVCLPEVVMVALRPKHKKSWKKYYSSKLLHTIQYNCLIYTLYEDRQILFFRR